VVAQAVAASIVYKFQGRRQVRRQDRNCHALSPFVYLVDLSGLQARQENEADIAVVLVVESREVTA
jgi:hypothetical protein